MFGGKGNDFFEVDSSDDQVYELPGEGTNDRVWSSADYVLDLNVENLILQGAAVAGTGNSGDSVLVTIQGNTLMIMNTTMAQIHTDDLVFA